MSNLDAQNTANTLTLLGEALNVAPPRERANLLNGTPWLATIVVPATPNEIADWLDSAPGRLHAEHTGDDSIVPVPGGLVNFAPGEATL